MKRDHIINVIIDTNIFISFLIGKRLKKLKYFIVHSDIRLHFAKQNIEELLIVTKREKFKKYFDKNDLNNLIKMINEFGELHYDFLTPNICRDPKDDFLLGLSSHCNADYLVTGDSDLLILEKYQNTQIVTANYFEKILISR